MWGLPAGDGLQQKAKQGVGRMDEHENECVRLGCINVRGWGVSKLDDVSKEMCEWNIDIVGLTETHLRDDLKVDGNEYVMIGKGRKIQKTRGGGVALLHRKCKGFRVEQLDVGNNAVSEDILAVRLECKSNPGKTEQMIVIVVYMTVEGERATRENRNKYEILRKIVRDCAQEKIIIMGDMNGHIGLLGERINQNGELLDEFVDEMNLENLNVTLAEGRVTWNARNQESAIDYVLVNEKMRECVSRMWIDEDGMIDVVSDHNAMVVECKPQYKKVKNERPSLKKWRLREVKWEDFQVELSEMDWLYENACDVDEVNKKFVSNVRKAAIRKVGYVRTKNRKRTDRPWWNEDIRNARRERKRCNRLCRRLRKRRNESEEAKNEYQNAWEAYVKQQRLTKRKIMNAKSKCERNVIQSLREKGMVGGREWQNFLRGESKSNNECESLKVNGEVITDKVRMKESVKEFWEEVGGVGQVYDVRENCITLESTESNELNEIISKEEVALCLKKQKNGKSPGPDDIPYELYKNGGALIVDGMTALFNCVWEEEKVPKEWNECKVTLIHKGGYKSKQELKNYRPIALANTVSKVFSGVLNERLCKWIERERVLGEEQNGFRVDRRAEDNIFVVNELIEKKRRERSKLYLCFLDIEKAYDRVNREILWKVLDKVGLSEKIVKIIRSMYEDTKAIYRLGTLETDWVRSERGVRQGCILSPTLFSLYTEELAVRIRRMNAGVKVGDDKSSILLYADDVVVMSETAEELQRLLDVVGEYGRDFCVRFSSEKSKVMIVNRSVNEENMTWRLGDNELEQTTEYKYLGVWLSAKGCEKAKNEKISTANQWVGRLGSVARMRASKYDVLREVWKTVAVPNIMYSMDVLVWNENDLDKLEVAQNKVARIALNAPRYAAVEALRGDMGWSTFRERLRKSTLRYKVRLERMDDARLARKVYLWNIRDSKWGNNCMKMAGSSGMTPRWMERYLVGGQYRYEWKITDRNREGVDWNVKKWKCVIDRGVKEVGLRKWRDEMERKSTLEWYKNKKSPEYVTWYDGSLGGDLLFQARAQCMDVNARNYRWSESRSKVCQMCDMGVDETVEHIMLECTKYGRIRTEMMRTVLIELECNEGEYMEKTGREWMMLLLGLCEGTTERIVTEVKEFLESMWSVRNRH